MPATTTTTIRTVPNASSTTYSVTMWRRLRRRTFAPSRPALYPEQLGLLLLSLAAIGFGVYLVVRLLAG